MAPARAVTTGAGALAISQSSGNPFFAAFYNTFGDTVTVTGTGFPSGQDNIQLLMIPATATIGTTVPGGPRFCTLGDVCDLQPYRRSMVASTTDGVMADANGWFKAKFDVPTVQGGNYVVYAVYPTSSGNVVTTTNAFTVTPAIFVVSDFTGAGESGFGDPIQMAGAGFGNGETIQPIPSSFFSGAVGPFVAGTVPGSDESAAATEGTFDFGPETAGNPGTVGDLVGGTHTVTLLGLSTGASVSQAYITDPILRFSTYSAGCTVTPLTGTPTFSIDTAAGAKVCIEGHGFAKSAVVAAAGSVTIGGIATISGEIDSNTVGVFPPTPVTLSQGIGVGSLSVVLGGTTFNYDNANIYQSNAALFDSFQGVLIGSHASQGALVILPEGSARRAGGAGAMIGFGYNPSLAYGVPTLQFILNPGAVAFRTVSAANGGAATDATATDANGAFMSFFFTPSVAHAKFTLHDNTAGNPAPDSTFTVNPTAKESTTSTSASLSPSITTSSKGFDAENLAVFIGGNLWANCASVANLCAANVPGPTGAFVSAAVLPGLGTAGILATDLPGGKYTVNVTGSASGDWSITRFSTANPPGSISGLTVKPIALGGALSSVAGPAGTSVALLTGAVGSANPGIHGLAANTAYNIMWDTTANVGSFTSTATGGVPVGTQFTVPAGTSGMHVVDIQTSSGTSAIWAKIKSSGGTQFANLIFNLQTSLVVTPSVANAGSTLTLSGNGLPASTQLYLTNCADLVGAYGAFGITYAQFTSTSTGSVPAGVTFTVPQQSNVGPETGRLTPWEITNNKGCAAGLVGVANFVYAAQMTLSSNAGPAGSVITATASGLVGGNVYDIVFNYAPLPTNLAAYTGSIAGVIIANALGQGTAQVTIPPSAASGSYNVGLVATCVGGGCAPGLTASLSVINQIPVFTVGGAVTGAKFTASGSPSQVSLGGTPFLSITYTNGANVQVTGIVIISVQNALGQTVYITTATISPAAGASATAYLDLGPLASGSYTANVFVISTGGGSLSSPTTGVAVHV